MTDKYQAINEALTQDLWLVSRESRIVPWQKPRAIESRPFFIVESEVGLEADPAPQHWMVAYPLSTSSSVETLAHDDRASNHARQCMLRPIYNKIVDQLDTDIKDLSFGAGGNIFVRAFIHVDSNGSEFLAVSAHLGSPVI
ncbi:hypothetical protein [Dongia sp.]|uniref:hypothetical protein n=1 Tax=Dongia sp. TaxID=1977262 RepID=UPI0035B37FCD